MQNLMAANIYGFTVKEKNSRLSEVVFHRMKLCSYQGRETGA